jgi:primosomal protein N''|tara:strand:+ start:827 stop:1006 length:180 start_codon:yes stop_codon:yes gene_type:complete
MALSNEDVLANLVEQRTELTKQLESGQVTLMKIQGAIETLEQIIEANKEEAPAEPVEEA